MKSTKIKKQQYMFFEHVPFKKRLTLFVLIAIALFVLIVEPNIHHKLKFNPDKDVCLGNLRYKIGPYYGTQKFPNITIQDDYAKRLKNINGGRLECNGEFRPKNQCIKAIPSIARENN